MTELTTARDSTAPITVVVLWRRNHLVTAVLTVAVASPG